MTPDSAIQLCNTVIVNGLLIWQTDNAGVPDAKKPRIQSPSSENVRIIANMLV